MGNLCLAGVLQAVLCQVKSFLLLW